MKKTVALLLAVIFAFSFSACKSDDTSSGSAVSGSAVTAEETIPETDIKDINVAKLDEDEDWVINTSENGVYAIPKFNVQSDYAEKLNKQLYDKYSVMAEKDNDSGYRAAYCKYSKYGSVVSMIITAYTTHSTTEYEIHNISLTDGTEVTDEKLVNYCKLTRSEYNKNLSDGMEYVFKTYYGSFSDSDSVKYEKYLNKTISADNLKNVRLYLSNSSTLSAVGTLYHFDDSDEDVLCDVTVLESVND